MTSAGVYLLINSDTKRMEKNDTIPLTKEMFPFTTTSYATIGSFLL
jgi:hypothetical protein